MEAWYEVAAGRSARLVAALAAGDVPEPFTVRRFAPVPVVPLVPAVPLVERPVTADQTNESVIVGERLVVKWLRPPGPGHRAPDLLAHLAAVGFTRMPTPYAAVLSGDSLVALVSAYLPAATDGWAWAVRALTAELTGGPSATFPADLGELTADLHVALATPSPVFPEPVVQVSNVDWVTPAARIVDRAVALISMADDAAVNAGEGSVNNDGAWLSAQSARMHRELAAAARATRTPVLRVHADLHVGQVLRWRDGYAVTDFDGNPTVPDAPVREPAARDVAQMTTSLAHIGQIVRRRTGGVDSARIADWTARGAIVFLEAYRNRLATQGMQWLFDQRLLRPFEVEQECRELVYSAKYLIRWRYAPMGVLRSWFDDRR
jgi:maltokinase